MTSVRYQTLQFLMCQCSEYCYSDWYMWYSRWSVVYFKGNWKPTCNSVKRQNKNYFLFLGQSRYYWTKLSFICWLEKHNYISRKTLACSGSFGIYQNIFWIKFWLSKKITELVDNTSLPFFYQNTLIPGDILKPFGNVSDIHNKCKLPDLKNKKWLTDLKFYPSSAQCYHHAETISWISSTNRWLVICIMITLTWNVKLVKSSLF